jgi:hypothetical protein
MTFYSHKIASFACLFYLVPTAQRPDWALRG